jgi:predicted RNA binding protein YcfA (HicA-like mRNA interferase family)
MPPLVPVSRRELIRRLQTLGFEGPYTGGRHELMLRRDRRLILPNPHREDIGVALLARLLRQAGVTREEWQALV